MTLVVSLTLPPAPAAVWLAAGLVAVSVAAAWPAAAEILGDWLCPRER